MDGEITDAAASGSDPAPRGFRDDDRIAWPKLANVVVDRDRRVAIDQVDQHVALLVHMLGRSVAGAPNQ